MVVHDHLTLNYNDKFVFDNAECGVHLLRRLEKNNQTTGHKWSENMFGLILVAKDDVEKHRIQDIDKLYDDYDSIIEAGLKENENDKENAHVAHESRFLRDLRAYKDSYLLFASREDVPFSNNVAERGLRTEKTKLKVSGQFANIARASDHARIKSYLETGKRCGYNVYDLIATALNEEPFTVKEMIENRKAGCFSRLPRAFN